MKIAAFALFGFVVGFALVFLMGAFYNVSLNIAAWTEHSRTTVSVLGFMFGVMLSAAVAYDLTDKKR